MKAQIITIGDEILIGQIVDTNSAWIADRLNLAGITVESKLSIGDRREQIIAALDNALSASDIVILTGGLGPTKDDITKLTLSDYFHSPLVRCEAVYQQVERMMKARGIDFNALNRSQAMVPECCTVLENSNGTAPGMWFERDGKVVVSLPGVPFEMEELMKQLVLPRLIERFSLGSNTHRTAITFGLAESMLAERIATWEDALPEWLHLAYLPNPSGIRLRLSAYDVDRERAEGEIAARFAALEKIIPQYLFGYGDDTLAKVTAQRLTQTGKTLSVAESCTGGALSAAFTAIAGASEYFMGSVTSYSNRVKEEVLGVSGEDLERYGAVSQSVACQMAQGVRRLCHSYYGIATTGIAGPTGATADQPVGTIWIAISSPERTIAEEVHYGRLRKQNIERAVAAAINMLRMEMERSDN